MYTLEELPPPPRRQPAQPAPKQATPRFLRAALIAVVGAAATWAYARLSQRLSDMEGDLAAAHASLDDARGSLGLLWTTTTRLDESRVAQQDVLRDSLGLVRDFAEGGMRLWEAAFEDHERRVSANASRLREQQRSIGQLFDATAALHTRLDALVGQSRLLESDLRLASGTVTTLRQTLASLTGRLQGLDGQLAVSRTDQLQLASRMDGVEVWVDSFREQDLDAGAVRARLAALAADLRFIASRVDSLGVRVDSARTVTFRSGPG
jgi:chromosome segregation ATPase